MKLITGEFEEKLREEGLTNSDKPLVASTSEW